MWRKNLLVAPILEAALILVVGLAGWIAHQPLIFASLGPTAFEIVEAPRRPSSRPYNIIGGHFIGVVAGFSALLMTHAWHVPGVSAHAVPLLRVWAALIAAMLTVFVTLVAKATQPAAVATSLLISLGFMQSPKDAAVIMAAVVLMTVVGEPIRRWRAKDAPKDLQ